MDAREIVSAIARDHRPDRYAASLSEMAAVASSYADNHDGTFRDYFSPKGVFGFDNLSLQHIAPISWWKGDESPADTDMHNIMPGNIDAIAPRYDYPPGIVTEPSYDNGYWRSGIGYLSSFDTNFYEPADELKGDFARIFMYMGVVYSTDLWHGRATMLYTDGGYPCLSAYGRKTLLEWHRNDPVDETELRRDHAIAAFQGCSNPFVTIPDLAEYIWGSHSGETYPSDLDPEDPTDPEGPEDPIDPTDPEDPADPIESNELKGSYSLTADRCIGLRSPYVGADARWTFDGKDVEGSSIDLDGISPGRYELTYRTGSSSGKIIITVTP